MKGWWDTWTNRLTMSLIALPIAAKSNANSAQLSWACQFMEHYCNSRPTVWLKTMIACLSDYCNSLVVQSSFVTEKVKFTLRAKITALHSQLAFEGKGVGVKSVVTLRGADTSPQHKTNKKSKYNNYVYSIHRKMMEMLWPARYYSYQKLSESKAR